jgi:hypothetical protein
MEKTWENIGLLGVLTDLTPKTMGTNYDLSTKTMV